MTVFANHPTVLLVLLLVPTGLLLCLPKPESETFFPSSHPLASTSRNPVQIPPLPALTTYRAHMMLMTVLAILAVDFPVFPRSLVKCETFGVSLVSSFFGPWHSFLQVNIFVQMDLGVGSFVFSQGIVSAIQLIKDPAYLTSPILPKLLRVTRKSFPIIVLGCIRVVLVKGSDYPVIHFLIFFPFFCLHLLGAWNGIRTTLEFFHHACASSYHTGFTSSPSFTLSHSPCWSWSGSEYDVSLNHFWKAFWFSLQVNNWRFPISVSEIIYFSHLDLLWSMQIKKGSYLFLVRRRKKNIYRYCKLKLVPYSRLSRHPASRVVCGYHYSTTFSIFLSSSTEDAHQQSKNWWCTPW